MSHHSVFSVSTHSELTSRTRSNTTQINSQFFSRVHTEKSKKKSFSFPIFWERKSFTINNWIFECHQIMQKLSYDWIISSLVSFSFESILWHSQKNPEKFLHCELRLWIIMVYYQKSFHVNLLSDFPIVEIYSFLDFIQPISIDFMFALDYCHCPLIQQRHNSNLTTIWNYVFQKNKNFCIFRLSYRVENSLFFSILSRWWNSCSDCDWNWTDIECGTWEWWEKEKSSCCVWWKAPASAAGRSRKCRLNSKLEIKFHGTITMIQLQWWLIFGKAKKNVILSIGR